MLRGIVGGMLKSPNQYMFDYTQLAARCISPKDLPKDSSIINPFVAPSC